MGQKNLNNGFKLTDAEDRLFRRLLLSLMHIGLIITSIYVIRDNLFQEPIWTHYVPEAITMVLFAALYLVVLRYNAYHLAAAILIFVGCLLILFTAVANGGFQGVWMIYIILMGL